MDLNHLLNSSLSSYKVTEDSPSKRRRVDPFPPQSQLPQIPSSEPLKRPLRPLPAPLALLTVAHSLRSSALSLLPSLAKPPQSTNSHTRYYKAWSDYYRLVTASIVVLRAAVLASSSGEFRGGRIELRANAMLAEQLADVYEGTEHVATAASEGEQAITRAQAIAQSHPTFSPYIPSLTLLQVRLALLSPKRVKYARTVLKKLLSNPLLASPSPQSLAALYATHSTLAALPSLPRLERMAAWQTVAHLAESKGDVPVQVLATLARARLSLEADDCETTKRCLHQIRQYLGPATDNVKDEAGNIAQSEYRFTTAVKVEFRLIAALLAAHLGDVKEAKDLLKTTHRLLDSSDAASSTFNDGTVRVIGRNDSEAVAAASVQFQLPPHTSLYSFTYLASVAIHRDPYGKAPRSTLFVNEGIRLASERLDGKEALFPINHISSPTSSLASTARLKIHLHIFASELAIMRSSPAEATIHLLSAVSTMRKYSQGKEGDVFMARLVLNLGLIHLLKNYESEAERCFEAVIAFSATATNSIKSSRTKEIVSSGATTVQLAELSLLSLKLSQGHTLPHPSSSSISSSPIMSRSLSSNSIARKSQASSTISTRLQSLTRSLTSLDTSDSSSSSSSSSTPNSHLTPSLQFVISFTKALTSNEITKSKSNLSSALTATSKMSANHARALTLALLANLFEQTRNSEALKMLNSSLKMVQGMGGKAVPPESAGTVDECLVGNAKLGLWLGERLLASLLSGGGAEDEEKIRKQERLNSAHREVLREQEIEYGGAKKED